MSRWDRFGGWYTSSPKKPPPAHGIKLKKAGTTWWGKRWLDALAEVLSGDSGRLARGRTYARAGRTHDLVIQGGKVSAKVTGSRPTPYKLTIELAQLGKVAWQKAISGMAAKAQFSAELLAGQMPTEIDEVFRAAGTSLFPKQRADLVTACSCPDWGDPCKHVAAAHYVLGEALDRDPFLLFELRGMTKNQVLDALRAARGGTAGAEASDRASKTAAPDAADSDGAEIPKVSLGKLKRADYDKPREALPSLHFSFDAPAAHGAVLRQLGTPAAWDGAETPADVLGPLVRAAAENARRLALAEPLPPEGQRPARAELEPVKAKARSKPSAARSPKRKPASKRKRR